MCGEAATKCTMEVGSGSELAIRTTQPSSNLLWSLAPVLHQAELKEAQFTCIARWTSGQARQYVRLQSALRLRETSFGFNLSRLRFLLMKNNLKMRNSVRNFYFSAV